MHTALPDRPGSESPARREHIQAIAEQLFADRGYAATSMRTVAEAAGVNVATVYYHCGSKAQLFLAVYGRTIERIAEVVQACFATGGEFEQVVGEVLDQVVAFFVGHPTIPRILQRAAQGELSAVASSMEDLFRPLDALVAGELGRRADLGQIRAVETAPFLAASTGVVLNLTIAASEPGSVDLAAAQSHARFFILGALGIDPLPPETPTP